MAEINDFKLKEPISVGGRKTFWSGFYTIVMIRILRPKAKVFYRLR